MILLSLMQKVIKQLTRILNTIVPKVDIGITLSRKTYFCENVFNSDFQRHAVVSYLTNAFKKGAENKHTNHLESYWAAKTLHELGYRVDVVDYDYSGVVDFSKYAVIYGFGDQFEQSFYCDSFNGKRIVYSPGCNTVYSNRVSAERLIEFQQHGGQLDPRLIRAAQQAWPLQKYLSDSIICLGNDFVLNTYKNEFDQLTYHQLDCFPLVRNSNIPIKSKNFDKAKHNLLWFGSLGSVHKGLDIALELVARNPDLKLFIRGLNMKKEAAILQPYQALLKSGRVDIKPHVDLQSNEFEQLMMECGAAIFPSASEGGAAALLAVMTYGGLIPICTKSCGLDVEDIGFVSEQTTLTSVGQELEKYLQLTPDQLNLKTMAVHQKVSAIYNQQNYSIKLKQILQQALA